MRRHRSRARSAWNSAWQRCAGSATCRGLRPHAQARGPLYFAGPAEQRLADLHAAFADPETQIVMSLRGGYGSNYVLPGLDLELDSPTSQAVFCLQRSDRRATAAAGRTGPSGVSRSHGGGRFLSRRRRAPAQFSRGAGGRADTASGPGEGLRALKTGTARGTLYGGCLSILVSLLGTPWEPQTEGKLLFLEDTGAKPYQVDRMLWQLRHAGKLDGVTRHRVRRDARLRVAGHAARSFWNR